MGSYQYVEETVRMDSKIQTQNDVVESRKVLLTNRPKLQPYINRVRVIIIIIKWFSHYLTLIFQEEISYDQRFINTFCEELIKNCSSQLGQIPLPLSPPRRHWQYLGTFCIVTNGERIVLQHLAHRGPDAAKHPPMLPVATHNEEYPPKPQSC